MSLARRILATFRPRRLESSDDGFSLLEVIVALGILVTVMVTTAGFFVTSLKQSNGQIQAQEAAVLADQQLDFTRSVPIASLLSGRTQSTVSAAIASPPPGLDLGDDITASGNVDPASPPASTPAVPLSFTSPVGGTTYTVKTFIDQCYFTSASGSECKNPNGTANYPAFATTYGWVYRITVDVTYSLGGGRSCANNKPCYYVASTLRDGGTSEPCFNTNPQMTGCSTSQPTISAISPSSVTTGSTTNITLTGTHFDWGATVSLDTGGTVSNVNVANATSLTFTLTTDNTSAAAGTRTVTVTDPNGKFATKSLTVTKSVISVSGVAPSTVTAGSTVTMTVSGSGFQTGSQVSIPSTAGTMGTPTVGASSITFTFTAAAGSAASGSWPVTVTNPDGSSASANFTIPSTSTPISVTSVSPSTAWSGNNTFTISGTGFQSGATVKLDSTKVPTSSITSTTIKLTLGFSPSMAYHTFTVTNPDGTSASGKFYWY